ncbi:hypothetical protein EV360DRAFT_67607 [Lentinula raphanica]|nr:hypothetical protein EV360DRAFT_67607 [Lentinula raphanica]
MCYTTVNTKLYRCGAMTGQLPAPAGANVTLERPAATSTRKGPHLCRYMTQLHRDYQLYSDTFQSRPPHEHYHLLPFDQWLAIIRKAPPCGRLEVHRSYQKHHFDCVLDEYGRSACVRQGTPHKYFHAPGYEPMSRNTWLSGIVLPGPQEQEENFDELCHPALADNPRLLK